MGSFTTSSFTSVLQEHEGYDIDTYVESGTWEGVQLSIAAGSFASVYGIELDENCFGNTEYNNEKHSNVQVILGDTVDILPRLLQKYKDKPLFILLDAHFCQIDPPIKKAFFPLWRELEMIRDRGMPDIVAIDDMHTFGIKREELKLDKEVEEWEGVTTESILKFFGDRAKHSKVDSDAFVVWLG